VDEFVSAERNPDMRRAPADRLEKDEIAWLHGVAIDGGPELVLIAYFTRQAEAILGKDPLHEAAAIETARIAATIPVRHAAVRKGSLQERGAFRFW